jgi:vacuolar iron transporter family protein
MPLSHPERAAIPSAIAFAVGAALPLLGIIIAPSILKGIFRVTFWGTLAMLITAGIGALFGTTV